MDTFIKDAFYQICKKAEQINQSVFVCLMEKIPFYGGPEEGGWWGYDYILIAYQEFTNIEIAEKIKEQINKFAETLTKGKQKEYNKQCSKDTDWLNARGLNADFLSEPDGPSEYYVLVTKDIPENHYGSRHYE